MTGKIFFKLLSAVLCLLLVALVAVDFFASRAAEANYVQNLTRQLGDKCRIAALSLGDAQSIDPVRIQAMARAAGARMTLVAPDGRVLADSEADAAHMENHLQRPEVREALAGREASRIRLSPTLGVNFLYAAAPVAEGALRLGVPLAEVDEQVAALRRKILASAALAFLPAVLLAALAARHASLRVAEIMQFAGEQIGRAHV